MSRHAGHKLLAALALGLGLMAAVAQAAPAAPEPAPAAPASQAAIQAGRRLYMTGTGSDGRKIVAMDPSGQPIPAAQARCVTCHRPSGYGSNEGGAYVPPITGPILFSPRKLDRTRLFPSMFQQIQTPEVSSRLHDVRPRPAYDTASLGRLLHDGIDAGGVPIALAMPRYRLAPRDVADLAAWLRTLSAHPDPGSDAQALHFVTILSDHTPPAIRKAIVDTARAYVLWTNRHTTDNRSRPNFSPYYRSTFTSFWRDWTFDVWELHGPPETWPRQLAARYAAAPPFAVISGWVPGPWDPVGRFCDTRHLPCLFPLTDLPRPETTQPGYTLYLDGGLPLQARAMAAYLATGKRPARVVQVAGAGPAGSVPAAAFRDAMRQRLAGVPVSTLTVARPDGWRTAIGQAARLAGQDGVLAIWPADAPQAAVEAVRAVQPAAARIMLAASAETAAKADLDGSVADRTRLMHPTELPGRINEHSFRVRAWLDARRVALNPPEAQYLVYYALSVLDKAVTDIQGDFFRDYLIEQIEVEAENNLNPGVYPTLSLGPSQRVASRGSYVVALSKTAPGGIRPDGDWIVP